MQAKHHHEESGGKLGGNRRCAPDARPAVLHRSPARSGRHPADARRHRDRKTDRWLSYRFYRALQRLKSPMRYICEIFGAPRFSSFSTLSARTGRSLLVCIRGHFCELAGCAGELRIGTKWNRTCKLRLGIPWHAKSYCSAKAQEKRLFEQGGLIGEGETISRFLPRRGVCAVRRLDGSNSTPQQKRVLVRQDVARRSDLARKRQALAQATGLSKTAPVTKRREIDSNERQSVEIGRQNLCRLVNRQGDAETQMRCRSNGLVLLQARQAQNAGAPRQRRVVR